MKQKKLNNRNKTSLITILFLVIFSVTANANEILSAGFYTGIQYDTCRLSGINGEIKSQNSIIIGTEINLVLNYFFIKSGADTNFTLTKGKVESTETSIKKTDIRFSTARLFIGLNIPIRLTGRLYSGCGAVFLIAHGSLTTPDGSENINGISAGPGFILGTEFDIADDFAFFVEWEYAAAITSPVADTSAGSYKDFSINFTGNRFHLGLCYYIL